MLWFDSDVECLEKRLKKERRPPNPVVFYGSSSIRLWEHLAEDLGDSRAVNAGFGGSTLDACVQYFDRVVRPLSPSSLVVYAGDNDLGDGRTPDDVLQSFRGMAIQVARLGVIPFGFMSIKLSPVRAGLREKIERANAMIREQIKGLPLAYYIDIYPAMLDQKGQPRAELFLEDGLHLSPSGYAVWTQVLKRYRHQMFITTSL